MKPLRAASLASTGMASSRLPSTTSTWRASSGTLARSLSKCGGTKWIMRSSRTGNSRNGAGASVARIATFSSAHKGVFWTLVVAALPVLAAAGAGSAADIVAIGRQIFSMPPCRPRGLDGKLLLSPRELRGLALFEDPQRGNCASCHPDCKGVDGSHPLFIDYQFEALGVPRNPQIQANAARGYFDQGLCR